MHLHNPVTAFWFVIGVCIGWLMGCGFGYLWFSKVVVFPHEYQQVNSSTNSLSNLVGGTGLVKSNKESDSGITR